MSQQARHEPVPERRIQRLQERIEQLEQAEQGHRQAEEVLHDIAQGTTAETGQAFFQALAAHLAGTLHVDMVFMGALSGPDQVQTLVLYDRDEFLDKIQYSLAGTPCAEVVHKKKCRFPTGVQGSFPHDQWLAQLGLDSYVGTPLLDGRGAVIGLMAVMDRKPMQAVDVVEATLSIFAARTAAELQRQQAEDALRASEEYHRLISELTSDYAYDYQVNSDRSLTLITMTEGFTRITGYSLEELERSGGWPRLIHPEDWHLIDARMEALHAGKPDVAEVRILTKAGEPRWIRYSTRPIWDAQQGRVVRLVGAVRDITDRKRDEEQLQDYAQKLQALSHRLLEVQEQERRHLARELHDEIGQMLTGLQYTLDLNTRVPPEQLRTHVAQAQKLVKDLMARVRNLSMLLRPAMLDDLGLVPALRWHVKQFSEQTQIQVGFEYDLGCRPPPALETAIYRMVQESLTNVARHAQVGQAVVRLWLEGDSVGLQIEDHGRGFDVDAVLKAGASSGLSGLCERARLLGGQLTIHSRPGAGTCLTAELPLPGAAPDDPLLHSGGRE